MVAPSKTGVVGRRESAAWVGKPLTSFQVVVTLVTFCVRCIVLSPVPPPKKTSVVLALVIAGGALKTALTLGQVIAVEVDAGAVGGGTMFIVPQFPVQPVAPG